MAIKLTDGEKLTGLQKKQKALELRLQGATYRQMRQELGTPIATLQRWVQNELDELNAHNQDTVAVLRRMQCLKLDQMTRQLWKVFDTPDHRAVVQAAQAIVKVEERRAKLLGLDAPVVTLTGDLQAKDQAQLEQIAQRLGLPLTIDVTGIPVVLPGG